MLTRPAWVRAGGPASAWLLRNPSQKPSSRWKSASRCMPATIPDHAAGRRDAGAGGNGGSPGRPFRAGQLSGGQRRWLDVALALIGDPELVFLDEPTTGFDPAARQSAWRRGPGSGDLGKTIFLTTHYMEEAEHLADRIAVIAAGRIVAEGTPATLGGRGVRHHLYPPVRPVGRRPAARRGCGGDRQPARSKHMPPARCQCRAPWPPGRRPAAPTFRCSARRWKRSPATHPGVPMTAISHDTGHAAGPRQQLRHLAVHQFRADLRCFYRNKQSVFFTLALPFLVGSVFQHQNVAVPGRANRRTGGPRPRHHRPDRRHILQPGRLGGPLPEQARIRSAVAPLLSAVIAGRALVAACVRAGDHRRLAGHRLGRVRRARPDGPGLHPRHHRRLRRLRCLGFAVASLITNNSDAAQPAVLAIVRAVLPVRGVHPHPGAAPLADRCRQHLPGARWLMPSSPPTTRTPQGRDCAGATWPSWPPGSCWPHLRHAPLQLASARR